MIMLVGPLPDPVHGASLVTARVASMLSNLGEDFVTYNTAPPPGCRRIRYHLHRLKIFIRACFAIATCPPKHRPVVYLSVSGGLGLFYDLMVVGTARVKKVPVIFHHHSFSYIVRRRAVMHAIVWLGGSRQRHVLLCPTMSHQFATLYGNQLRSQVISNLAFLNVCNAYNRRRPGRLMAIGYLSNISFAKGIDRYLDLLEVLRSSGRKVRGVIAGPFDDERIQRYVERRIESIGGIEYRGPVYGEAKRRFFQDIDLLVFPTRYVNEAQPLVVFEAQLAGVLVASSDRGCLRQMIKPTSLLMDSTASDFDGVLRQLYEWLDQPQLFEKAVHDFHDEVVALQEQQQLDLQRATALLRTASSTHSEF